MSFNPNNFITYADESQDPSNSTHEELDFSTSGSPFTSLYDTETKSDTHFGSSTHSSGNNNYSTPYHTDFDNDTRKRHKPFKIIRTTMKEREEMIKLCEKSKKIKKRCLAKERAQARQEIAALIQIAPKKYIPSGIEDPDNDDRTRRRLVQKLKNRLASQATRDQRKKRMSELEEVKAHLERANKELNEKNRLLEEKNQMLEERLKTIESEKILLLEENNGLRQKEIPDFDSKPVSIGSFNDTEEYFDFTEEDEGEKRISSPTLTRKKGRIQNNYFNFLLGALTICVACSGVAIQVVQRTVEHKKEAIEPTFENFFKDSLTEYSDALVLNEKRIYLEDIFHYIEAASAIRNSATADTNHYTEGSGSMSEFLDSVVDAEHENRYKINVHKNRTQNYYFGKKNGLGSLRTGSEEESEISYLDDLPRSAASLARAGRVSRAGARGLRLLRIFDFITVMLSIFLICFCLYRFKFSQRLKQNKNYSAIVARMKGNIETQTGRFRRLQSKISSWYSKYINGKSLELEDVLLD